MRKILRDLLVKLINDIDSGNTNISEDDSIKIAKVLKSYLDTNKVMSKYQAYSYLNVSRATFDNMVRSGDIPRGKKIEGFKELFWFKEDLDNVIKNK